MEIKTTTPALTTVILKMKGLTIGGDYVNRMARKYVKKKIDAFKNSASTEVQQFVAGADFERIQERWWRDFEEIYKRNLKQAREQGLLNKAGMIPVHGLQEETERASYDLANRTLDLINQIKSKVEKMFGITPNVSQNDHLVPPTNQDSPYTVLVAIASPKSCM